MEPSSVYIAKSKYFEEFFGVCMSFFSFAWEEALLYLQFYGSLLSCRTLNIHSYFCFYLLPSSCQRILLSSFLSFFSSLHFRDDSHKSYLSIKIVPAPLNHSWPFKSALKSLSCSLCSGHLFCIFRFSVDLIFLASFQIIFRLLQYPSSSRFPTNFLSLLLLAQSLVAVWGESMCTGIDAVSFFYS